MNPFDAIIVTAATVITVTALANVAETDRAKIITAVADLVRALRGR